MPTNSSIIHKKHEDKKNIFNTQFSGGKSVMEKRLEYVRSKNYKKAYTILAISITLLTVYSSGFLYGQVNKYLKSTPQIEDLNQKIKEYDNSINELNNTLELHKSDYDNELKGAEEIIGKVFPGDIDRWGIVKLLEDFSTRLHTRTPPFEFNAISFSAPEKEGDYIILPIKTSIKSSTKNFNRFLELINLSGRLDLINDEEVPPIRLMAVSNISIKYKGINEKTGLDQGVDFSVELNAYSRKP